ncbi:MAG: leucine-rich repeat domain-containing protein, partial [Agathobacter sp.]|nr:leucine-rich repeat domain-containing protein [Agathobacter sp.]
MKRRCKRLLALFLSVGMLATQFPSVNTTIMADTGTETSDSTSETTGISDDTVIATNDWDYADTHGSECVYISNYDSIFYIIAKKLNKSGSTINLTYGDVKGITEFTISDENTDRYYVNVDNLDKLLPNLTKLTTSKSVSGSSSLKLHELNYVGNGDYAGNVSEAFDVSELDRISVAGGYIDLGDKKYPKLKTLSVTGKLNIVDYSQLQVIEELKITPYIYKNEENDSYQYTYSTDFTQKNIDQISNLGTLKQLDLSGNTVLGNGYYDSTDKYMYLDLSALSELSGLESLNLSSCGLQQFPDIKNLDSLNNLYIYDNKDLIKAKVLKLVPEKFASDDKWVADNFISENEIVTMGDNKSDYYIPDKNLYAYLLKSADRNSDGILTVAEAWSVTYLNMDSNYNDTDMGLVDDFSGLGDVFKNVTSLTISSYTKWAAQESLFNEISKFKDMTNLTSYTALYQKSLDTICSDLPELTYLYVYSAGKLDMTNISKLSKLDYLHIGSDIKNAGGINKLNLSRLEMHFDDVKYSDISDVLGGLDYLQMSGNISDDMFDNINKLTNITSLHIEGGSEKNTDKTIDVSSLNKLEYLSISSYGVISKIILPSDNSNLRYLHISGSSFEDNGQTTIDNLAKNTDLTDLTLNNCGVTDFDEIKNCTKLRSLDISYTGLTKTEGLENLENISDLEISNNSALKEISGLDKLNKLSTLTISNNDSLSKLSSTCEFSNLIYLYIQDNDNLSEVDFDLGNAAKLERIFITENYKLTKVPDSISKLTTLKVLHLQNNALESLPDLSGLCTEKGLLSKGYYWNDYSSYNNKRLEIFGNGFSADDITNAGITGFTDDKNWVALSQTKRTDNGTLLYTGLTEE